MLLSNRLGKWYVRKLFPVEKKEKILVFWLWFIWLIWNLTKLFTLWIRQWFHDSVKTRTDKRMDGQTNRWTDRHAQTRVSTDYTMKKWGNFIMLIIVYKWSVISWKPKPPKNWFYVYCNKIIYYAPKGQPWEVLDRHILLI